MTPDLLICDCDGVLVDSEVIACRIDAEELARRGFGNYPLDEVLRRFAGMSQRDMIDTIERESGRSLGSDFSVVVAERVERALAQSLEALPGADMVLAEIGLPKCVASSSTTRKLMLSLTATGLIRHFEPHIFSSTLVKLGKPAPDLFVYAAAQFGASRDRCCVIEDSPAGVAAARAADMTAIGFIGGSHCRRDHAERLRSLGAAAIVSQWVELPSLLLSILG